MFFRTITATLQNCGNVCKKLGRAWREENSPRQVPARELLYPEEVLSTTQSPD